MSRSTRQTAARNLDETCEPGAAVVGQATREIVPLTLHAAGEELARLRAEQAYLEEMLRESDMRYQQLFENTPCAMWVEDYSRAKCFIDELRSAGVCDIRAYFEDHPDALRQAVRDIVVLDVNDAACKLHGVPDSNACAPSAADFKRWSDGDWKSFYTRQITAFADGRTRHDSVYRDRAADGSDLVAWSRAHMAAGHEHDWSRVITIFQDITALEATGSALVFAKERAELANRAKSEFLANMSHELRTPLNAIIGFAEMIESGAYGPIKVPKYLEYVGDIRSSGEHLLGLINDILDISKIEAGKLVLDEIEVDVERVVHSSVGLVRARANARDVQIALKLPRILPRLRADERKLKQCLINLLSNAAKFTLAGGWIDVSARTNESGGIEIAVSDTGIGIAVADIPLVLSPFGQVESHLERRHEGTGLGLPLTKALVELHGGALELRSEVGAGTVATVVFPPNRTVAH